MTIGLGLVQETCFFVSEEILQVMKVRGWHLPYIELFLSQSEGRRLSSIFAGPTGSLLDQEANCH